MHAEQQRFWIALLNLQRGWATDEAALSVVPTRSRDFTNPADWPQKKALIYLLNALELVRNSLRRLEAGQPLDYEGLNTVLEGLHLKLFPWVDLTERRRAADARQENGGRLETLQVTSGRTGSNPGTRWVRATVERCLYYFAQYVDDRLSDPLYPQSSPGRWRVVESEEAGGDLVLVEPALQAPGIP